MNDQVITYMHYSIEFATKAMGQRVHFVLVFLGLIMLVCRTLALDNRASTSPPVNVRPCRDPSAPLNGSVMVWGDNMLVEYTCDPGLFPLGYVFGSCNPFTKRWSIRRPRCVSSDCDDPGTLLHGKIYFSNNRSITTATCKPGYKLIGTKRRYCNGHGWSGKPPYCRDKYPASADKREVGEGVDATDRNALFERQLELDVLDADDTCYRRFSPPPEIDNGKPTVGYKYNSVKKKWISIANYSCDDGFVLEDEYQRYKYCKEYKWIGNQDPKCVIGTIYIDPCVENNGGCSQICTYLGGKRFTCGCELGFELEPSQRRRCYDINECALDNGGCNQTCNNLIGSYFCTCFDGYSASGHSCYDIDECQDSSRHKCPGECINKPGSFTCNCTIEGFAPSTDDQICEDVDECKQNNGGCEDTCINLYGSFKCRCFKKGFRLSLDERTCEDVDECMKYGKNRCQNGECVNVPGSYLCQCDEGYHEVKNKRKCIDSDECSTDNGGCQHVCINTPGNFSCSCHDGFELDIDGRTCSDVDECMLDNGSCEERCTNTQGSYTCLCPDYLWVLSENNRTCTYCDNRHYYDNSTGQCVRCMEHSSVPGYIKGTSPDECMCEAGFEHMGDHCKDIDECETGLLVCEQVCTNVEGYALCTCAEGYSMSEDGQCADIDECSENKTECVQYCNNTVGSYDCYCNDGFVLGFDGYSCEDLDECYEDMLTCDQTCVNYPGGATCECLSGYVLAMDNITCADIDECKTGDHLCSDVCVNMNGSYACECSGPGFKLSWDRSSCIDLNECMEGDNECQGECINTIGSYRCDCSSTGLRLASDNRTCLDTDECSQDGGNRCEQQCINLIGSYRCDCNPGYALASFHTCAPCPRNYFRSTDIPECTACPPLSRTRYIAMTSLSDCQCLPGYQGNLTAGEMCRPKP